MRYVNFKLNTDYSQESIVKFFTAVLSKNFIKKVLNKDENTKKFLTEFLSSAHSNQRRAILMSDNAYDKLRAAQDKWLSSGKVGIVSLVEEYAVDTSSGLLQKNCTFGYLTEDGDDFIPIVQMNPVYGSPREGTTFLGRCLQDSDRRLMAYLSLLPYTSELSCEALNFNEAECLWRDDTIRTMTEFFDFLSTIRGDAIEEDEDGDESFEVEEEDGFDAGDKDYYLRVDE